MGGSEIIDGGLGTDGVLAYSVNQRKREIGLSLVMAGVPIGFVAALAAGRLLSGMLFGVGASHPLSAAGAALVFGVGIATG